MEAIVYFRLTYKYGPMNANLSECHVFIIGAFPNYYLGWDGLFSVQNECPMEQVGHFQARQTKAPGPTDSPADEAFWE